MNYERNWYLPAFFNKGEKVLDLGCGDGAVAEYLQEKIGVNIVGADISEDAVKKSRKRGIDARLIDIEKGKLPFAAKSFDVIFWGDNIEHLFDPESILKEIRRVLKPNGRLVLSCPNMAYWRYRIFYFLNGQLPDTEWTGYKPWAWSHIRFFNASILKNLLEINGFKIEKLIGVNRIFPDKFFAKISPNLFGMIILLGAKKI